MQNEVNRALVAKKKFNKTNMTMRKYISLGGLRAVLMVLLIAFGVGNAWGHSTHYNRANVALATGSTGGGTVYLIENNTHKTQSAQWDCGGNSSGTHSKNFECHCEGWADGYYFAGWNTSSSSSGGYANTNATATLSFGDQNSTYSPGDKYYYAWTLAVEPTAASGDVSFSVDNLSTTYTKTVSFTQTGGDAQADFNNATISLKSGGGTWAHKSTTYNSSTKKVDVQFTYTAGRSTWTNAAGTRTDKATLTLSSKGNKSYSVDVTANLPAVTVSAGTGSSVAMNHAADTQSGSVTFPVTSVDSKTDLNEPTITKTSGEGTWAITGYSYANGVVTVNYSHTGSGTYGTRASAATITLSAKAGESSNTCNVTATYPALAFGEGSNGGTAYPEDPESDGSATASFVVYHADSEDDFTCPTSIASSTGGTWTLGSCSFAKDQSDASKGTYSVGYTYNAGGVVTTNTATMTLNAKSGASQTVTITGITKQVSVNEASVTPAGGTEDDAVEYATFDQALTEANKLTGATLTLLKSVDLGTITATKNITKAMTIDLNGKTLKAAVNATSIGILTITQAVAVTIKDSKTGGKIINEVARNSEIRTIFVNKAGATLTLESGTIAVNNTKQFRYGVTDHTDGEANVVSCAARAIHQIAGSTVNIKGGKVQSKASRNGYGIYQASSASTQRAGTTVLNISGGEIYSECSNRAYGVAAYGKVNLSGGTITAKLNTETVNANTVYVAYKPDDDSYVVHNYIYALQMNGGASVTAASNYYGELNMTGGEVVAINENVHTTATRSLYIYGIFFNAGSVNVKTGTASDGTYSQKWAAVGDISGGSVRVENAGTLAYGVYVGGEYNSHDDSHTVTKIKNFNIDVSAYQSAYGVYASASVGTTSNSASPNMGACYAGDVELTNTTVNATTTDGTTAYALMVVSTYGTVFKNATMTKATDAGYTQVYDGEFASAAKMTVNSGTYTAESKKSSTAYAAASSTRSRTIFASTTSTNASRELGGHKEAYAELIIHGGTFTATTSTSEARAVSVGGHTTIDGGHFYANAGSSTARGIYCVSGTLKVSGVDVHSEANSSAFGISLSGGISDNTGFSYSADAELNNLTVEVKTRTGNEADGVLMEVTKKNLPTIPTSGEYMNMYQKGEYAIAPKAIINGGTYTVTSEGTSAYGVSLNSAPLCEDINGDGILAIGEGDLTIKNAEFTVETKTGNAAYGVWAGGKTSVENTKFTITSATSDAYGLRAYYGKSSIKNSTFDVTATTATAVGLRAEARMSTVNGSNGHHTTNFSGVEGYELEGEIESEGNTVTVKANGGNTAYGIQVISAKGSGTKTTAAAGLAFKGDHACAGKAVVNGGKYTATASGTTAYAVIVSAPATQGEATATPTCIINDGKFKGSATSTYADVNESGVAGYCVLNGGFYVVNTNLSKYVAEGYEEFPLPSDRPEYTEGYRYAIEEVGNHGIDVCKIGSKKYKSLEEALQEVTSNQTILMIANYTLSAGDWVLPSGAKLLVPRASSQTAFETNFDKIVKYNEYTTPSAYITLTLASGARLDVLGEIQVASLVSAKGQMNGNNGTPSGPHGKIVLEENSKIILENNAKLYAWGYITGPGMIDAKRGSFVYECMQIRDWRGGSNTRNIYNSVFPFNQYFIQNVESRIRFRPGAEETVYGSVNASSSAYPVNAKLIGTSGAMFLMSNADVSEDTWVQKSYDFSRDYQVYEVNSAAQLSSLTVSGLPLIGSVSTSNYNLPLVNNMHIHLLTGKLEVIQSLLMQPGVVIEIDKEAKCVVASGKKIYVQDSEDTQGYDNSLPFNTIPYSPQGSVSGKRTLTDASINIHGAFEFIGYLYTSEHGANIFSTNEDAGSIIFKNSSPANASVNVCNTGGTVVQKTFTTPQLKNEEGETPAFTPTTGSVANDEYAYSLNQWRKWESSGCFAIDKGDNANWKYFVKPAEYVQVTSGTPDGNHLHHDAATGERNFIWDADCHWWEVVTTPTAEGYYLSLNVDHNGKYNYYYYDSSANCWKIKKITVTWNIDGSTTNYSVGYGTKPEWLGATPSKNSNSSNYVWRWDGWTVGSDPTVLDNEELPYVTENITFTAHFYEKYYQYNIIFKNDDGTVLDSRMWNKGTTPYYEGTPEKTATASQTFEFNDTWSPAIHEVSGSEVYVAQYTATTRQYTITFLNYDMSLLGTVKVDYNDAPTHDSYLAAVSPVVTDPYKPDNSAFSFEFSGWRLQGASSNGFAQVKGDQTYVAQFAETTKKYRITFLDEDGETVLHWIQLEYDAMPSYDGPATSGFNKQDVEWLYEFTGWTPAEFTAVKGPQTYTATYNKTHREYPITWIDGNGNTLTTTNVEYGTTPTYPGTPAPTKTATNTIIYTFNNTWSPVLAPVTGEATYTAQFNESERTYALTIGVNNAEFGSVSPTPVTGISYNASVTVNGNQFTVNGTTVTATPHAKTAQYTYKFDHWENVPNSVTADVANIQAVFTRTVNKYHITWLVKLNGETLESKEEDVEYGTVPSYGSTPTKEQNQSQVFTFSGWEPKPYAVEKDETYIGSFNVSPRPYTITFVNDNGTTILQNDPVGWGSAPEYKGDIPVSSHAGDGYTYEFAGWKNNNGDRYAPNATLPDVAGEATYTAVYNRSAEAIIVNTPEIVTMNTTTSSTTVEKDGTLTVGNSNTQVTLSTDTTIVKDGGQVIVTAGSSIGNDNTAEESIIIVESGGQLEVTEGGSVEADVFIIQATTEEQGPDEAKEEVQVSGELSETGSKNLSAIYYDLTRKHGTENFLARVWYAVAVPWAVEVAMNTNEGGVYIKRGDEYVKQRLGTSYDLLWYDGDCRAQNGAGANCWVYLEDEIVAGTADAVMVPGKLYMIYLTEETSTIRFEKKAGEAIHTKTVTVSPHAADNGNDANWNGIANPATYRAYMNVTANGLVQKFVPGTQPRDPGQYIALDLNNKQAVGQPFFVQVNPNAGTTVVANRTNPSTVSARYVQEPQDARYAIGIATNGKLADRLYIQTTDEKEDKYTIGKDMSKMGVSTYVAQMWVNRYDSKLCQNTVAWTRNKADYSLGISAPQAGEYMIFAPADIDSRDNIYLTLDGRVIWNLSYSPYYASLEQGTTTRYGLRIVRDNTSGGTTGVDEVHSGNIQCEKVIMDDHVYILRGEELYTVTGQKAK